MTQTISTSPQNINRGSGCKSSPPIKYKSKIQPESKATKRMIAIKQKLASLCESFGTPLTRVIIHIITRIASCKIFNSARQWLNMRVTRRFYSFLFGDDSFGSVTRFVLLAGFVLYLKQRVWVRKLS